jgi:uncharacterized protein YneF (UPF0154 family)
MTTFLWIVLIVVAFVGGIFAGMYLVRRQLQQELADKPVLTVDAVRLLMGSMGQKPNEAKVQQVYRQLIKQSKEAAKK